jgi:hypothetical protein
MERLASMQLDTMAEVNRLAAMQAAGFTPPGLLNVSSGGLLATTSTVHGIGTARGMPHASRTGACNACQRGRRGAPHRPAMRGWGV